MKDSIFFLVMIDLYMFFLILLESLTFQNLKKKAFNQ